MKADVIVILSGVGFILSLSLFVFAFAFLIESYRELKEGKRWRK